MFLQNWKHIFFDNLDVHLQQGFLELLKIVDAELGRLTKYPVSQEFEEWLEIEDSLEIWANRTLSASEKRILVTKFVGAAWDKIFLGDKYNTKAYLRKQEACCHQFCMVSM